MFFLYNWPPLRNLSVLKPPPPEIEVTYHPARKAPVFSELIDEKQRLSTATAPVVRKAASTAINKTVAAKPEFDLKRSDKPALEILKIESDKKSTTILSEDKMLISHEKKDLSEEPTYLNYYNAVRAKIYKAANASKPRYYMEGDVRVVFTLRKDGSLINTAVAGEGSTTNPILRNHALMSIRKASPFPPFHASIKERELILRITISFER